MQIHVVKPGDSLFGISRTYGVSAQTIAGANEINPQLSLVVGQALVIPIQGRFYVVKPGDSLYSISLRFSISAQVLAAANRIAVTTPLSVGSRLYIPEKPKYRAEVNAYLEPRGGTISEDLQSSARAAARRLTYLAPFSFQIQRDGSLKEPPLTNLRTIADPQNVTLMMVVTNLENDQFSADLAHVFLTNEAIQNKLLDNILSTAGRLGFRDIHFDIEFVKPTDREAYNTFLRKAATRIHQAGYLISTALAPKTSAQQTGAWYTAHDYRAHGQIVDFSIPMTYEWGYSGSPPMPVSPIDKVEQVIRYALSEMPANKILMGQNLYGYDWTLPFVQGGEYAKAVSPQQAIDLARKYHAIIQYDTKSQAPHFNYWDEQGREHKVWFEDARSIQAKFNLIKRLNLRGISYWKLGLSFPQNWLLIEDNFNVVKITR